jgi:hypothetical protein
MTGVPLDKAVQNARRVSVPAPVAVPVRVPVRNGACREWRECSRLFFAPKKGHENLEAQDFNL